MDAAKEMTSAPTETVIPIRTALVADYYDSFQCSGDRCHYHCCKEWGIFVKRQDYMFLRNSPKIPPALRGTMKTAVRRLKNSTTEARYATIVYDDHQCCPLLDEKGLCALQLACGPSALPEICQTFPRDKAFSHSGYEEHYCTTSCEAVIELLLTRKDGLRFVTAPLPAQAHGTLTMHKSTPLLPYFQEIRSFCISVLQNRAHRLPQRMILLGLVLRELAMLAENGVPADLGAWLAGKQAFLTDPGLLASLAELPQDTRYFCLNNLRLLARHKEDELESLGVLRRSVFAQCGMPDVDITIAADGSVSQPLSVNLQFYEAARASFDARFGDLAYLFENIMVNIFFGAKYPDVVVPQELWDSYMDFCTIYSFFRFMAVCATYPNGTRDDLIHVLTVCSRSMVSSSAFRKKLISTLRDNDCTTLAHMAILVND